ncbi:MAG: hypothetical protein M1833_006103 [Piccolia ochrophora]|nr:MAG: hypothetical protein M1833_006103 [Piccolia ochrophora]
MKYGQTLRQRSIPEWASYNIDYDELKHIIKACTSKDKTSAVAIPRGITEDRDAAPDFEDELFDELRQQHERIDLFLQSKSGEVHRRLNDLHKTISRLTRKGVRGDQKGISIGRLERFSKAEEEVLKAGEEIQALSRFAGAQRLGFKKLLKKYQKWTASASLGQRFSQEILRTSTTLAGHSFEPLLTQWTNLLAAVRAPFDGSDVTVISVGKSRFSRLQNTTDVKKHDEGHEFKHEPSSNCATSAARLHDAIHDIHDSSAIVLDAAFDSLTLGAGRERASYWVHDDNMVELEILLLQHSRLHQGSTLITKTGKSFSVLPEATNQSNSQPNEKCEERSRFLFGKVDVSVQTPDPQSENLIDHQPRAALDKVAGHLRLASDGLTHTTVEEAAPEQSSLAIEEWLASNRDLQPLAQIKSWRSRFVGLSNNSEGGLWLTLDKNITMAKSSIEEVRRSCNLKSSQSKREGTKHCRNQAQRFPHAVLNCMGEGDSTDALIKILDESHLTKKVPSFSLDTHVIAALYHHRIKDYDMPSWMPDLHRDIRELPTRSILQSKNPSGQHYVGEPGQGTTVSAATLSADDGHTSSGPAPVIESSATSVADLFEANQRKHSSSLRASNPKRKRRSTDRPYRQPSGKRYWNEYDNDSEEDEADPYILLIDPHHSLRFPGQGFVSKVTDFAINKVHGFLSQLPFFSKLEGDTGERRPLIPETTSTGIARDDAHLDDSSSYDEVVFNRQYSTYASPKHLRADADRERLIFRSCIGCFTAAMLLLTLATLLAVDARRKLRFSVNAGVVMGVIASLSFAVAGIGLILTRKERLGWTHRSVFFMLFCLICIASGFLLAFAGNYR